MASLRGQVGVFTLFDYRREQLDKDFTGLVNGASQDGNTLIIDGLAPNQTLLVAGERFQVGAGELVELKMLTQDLVTNASGVATVMFESPLRKIPVDNTPLYFIFRLIDNKQGISEAKYKNGIITNWRIKGREAF